MTYANLQVTALISNQDLFQPSVFINNEFIKSSGKAFDVYDPSTGRAWATLNSATTSETDQAIQAAKSAFNVWSKKSARERARFLLDWEHSIRENINDIAKILVLETGKPIAEAKGEIEYGLSFCWWMAGEAERQHGSVANGTNEVTKFVVTKYPVGVVGTLTPWNFPVALFLRKVCTALAAGCTVVNKPSPETPLTCNALAFLAKKLGLPAGVINNLPCDETNTPLIGELICTHPVIKKVSFTGSTPVGKKLSVLCADKLKKLTLELGGNGAFIVFDDSDIDHVVNQLMICKFRNAGQTCVCAQRVFIQEGVHDEVIAKLKERIKDLNVGHGLDSKTTIGPLTTQRSVEKAKSHLEDAESKGGVIFSPFELSADISQGFYILPTLIENCNDEMLVASQESFAPILSVFKFSTEEEVIERANNTSMGLTSYAFTKDSARIWRLLENLEVGNLGINSGLTTSAEAPFGGWKDSGYGKEAGMGYGISEYLKVKTATWNIS